MSVQSVPVGVRNSVGVEVGVSDDSAGALRLAMVIGTL